MGGGWVNWRWCHTTQWPNITAINCNQLNRSWVDYRYLRFDWSVLLLMRQPRYRVNCRINQSTLMETGSINWKMNHKQVADRNFGTLQKLHHAVVIIIGVSVIRRISPGCPGTWILFMGFSGRSLSSSPTEFNNNGNRQHDKDSNRCVNRLASNCINCALSREPHSSMMLRYIKRTVVEWVETKLQSACISAGLVLIVLKRGD